MRGGKFKMESDTYTIDGKEFELRHHGVKGMKWGVRRYQNKDGSLTPAGEKRYDRDVRENNAKKKDNRINIDGPDPNRWVKEDIGRRKRVVDSTSEAVRELKKINNNVPQSSRKQKPDVSRMTDQQLRERINRMNLERQYIDMTSPQQISKGRKYVTSFLEGAGTAITITSSVLGIALAIKELKG
jgi:hypothetical protein